MRATGLALLLAVVLPAVSPRAACAVSADDLVGAWHVLVHYQDSQAGNPEAKRWEDRIWVFDGDRHLPQRRTSRASASG